MSRTAIVFAGGDAPPPEVVSALPEDAYVIAADSGHDHAIALGRSAHRIVGDLDSADLQAVTTAVAGGAELEEHPRDKDATDLELALVSALESDIDDVIVVGGHGGRIDHFLANTFLLASPMFASMSVRAFLGDALVTVVHTAATLHGAPGDVCSLLALGAPATGVTTTGLRWELDDGLIEVGSTLGMSNEFTGDTATISLDGGVLVVIQPRFHSTNAGSPQP